MSDKNTKSSFTKHNYMNVRAFFKKLSYCFISFNDGWLLPGMFRKYKPFAS